MWVFERYKFDKENKVRNIDLMKKVGFEMFSEIDIFFVNLWCSNWLRTFRALGWESLV
jgi:hypothetical protein